VTRSGVRQEGRDAGSETIMASIPPTWLASNIQGVAAQQRTAETRDRDAADAAKKAGGESPFARELTDAIETGDRDEQVDADGQGGGGQGRESDAPDDADQNEQDENRAPSRKPPGTGLDLEA
jgi:hypothetical protein